MWELHYPKTTRNLRATPVCTIRTCTKYSACCLSEMMGSWNAMSRAGICSAKWQPTPQFTAECDGGSTGPSPSPRPRQSVAFPAAQHFQSARAGQWITQSSKGTSPASSSEHHLQKLQGARHQAWLLPAGQPSGIITQGGTSE